MLQKKREAAKKIFEPEKEMNLDEELQKLERIKQQRRNIVNEIREKNNQEKLRQMTNLYFQKEYMMLNKSQREKGQGKQGIFYTQDYKNVKEVPDHRLKHREPKELESGEREVMIAPDSLEFFYAAEETSERAYKLERLLNRIYRVLVWLFASSVFVFVTMHAKQHYELQTYASDVSKKISKEGGKAVVGDDGSLTIYMDGKV